MAALGEQQGGFDACSRPGRPPQLPGRTQAQPKLKQLQKGPEQTLPAISGLSEERCWELCQQPCGWQHRRVALPGALMAAVLQHHFCCCTYGIFASAGEHHILPQPFPALFTFSLRCEDNHQKRWLQRPLVLAARGQEEPLEASGFSAQTRWSRPSEEALRHPAHDTQRPVWKACSISRQTPAASSLSQVLGFTVLDFLWVPNTWPQHGGRLGKGLSLR